jgi:N-acetylmuramoyl-L-alanine amidase
VNIFKICASSFLFVISLAAPTSVICQSADLKDPLSYVSEKAAPESSKSGRLTILLDPGHDYKSIGTRSSSGVGEYEFNNRFTHELQDALKQAGYTVSATHADNEVSSLKDRTLFSNYDLFISIHHDSIDPEYCITNNPEKGCTTYSGYGYSLWVSPENPYYDSSLKLAQFIGEKLTSSKFIHSVHHVMVTKREVIDRKTGIFSFPDCYVLRHNKKPAILIEVAVITNPIDEQNANDPSFRKKFIENIVNGISDYAQDVKKNNKGKR